MKIVLVALFVCAAVAMPTNEEVEEELQRRFLFNLDELMGKIMNPLKTLVGSDITEKGCELACKAGIHTVVPIPFVSLACGPACKELQHLGHILG